MPHVGRELNKLAGSTFFSIFDFSQGYEQLPLDESSRACQSFVTPDDIFSLTTVLQRTTKAVMFMHSAITSDIPPEPRFSLLVWLHDLLVHARSVSAQLYTVRMLLEFYKSFNLKIHQAKCVLSLRSIRWGGRVILSEGIRFDPRCISGIHSMESPTTGAHLQQISCALQWMCQAILDFLTIIRSLSEFLEQDYEEAGKRTKFAVGRIILANLGSGMTQENAFWRCKTALEHQVTFAHPDDSICLCVYTDASDLTWSGIVTQVSPADILKDHVYQRHQPLVIPSDRFPGRQLSWFTSRMMQLPLSVQ